MQMTFMCMNENKCLLSSVRRSPRCTPPLTYSPPHFVRYPFPSFLLYIFFFYPPLVVPSDNLKERRSNDNKEKEAQEDWPDCELRLPLVHIHLTTLRHILMKSCISMFQ